MYFLKFLHNKGTTKDSNILFGIFLEGYIFYSFVLSLFQLILGRYDQLPLYFSAIIPLVILYIFLKTKRFLKILPWIFVCILFLYFIFIDQGLSSGSLIIGHFLCLFFL